MNLIPHLGPIASLVAGILILIMPRLLNYIVAIYLILIGLLGVHSASLDVGVRDLKLDEALGLNCAWYVDILMTLTES